MDGSVRAISDSIERTTWQTLGSARVAKSCPSSKPGVERRWYYRHGHGEYLRQRVEREHRGVPDGVPDGNLRCVGNPAWRLNDSWSMICGSKPWTTTLNREGPTDCLPREQSVPELQASFGADGVDLTATDREQSWLK